MAELGDLLKEWHDAKPPEKLLIVGISVAALGIAIYIHSKTSTSTTPTNPVGGGAGMPGTIQSGGTPSNGQTAAPGTPTPTPPTHLPVVDPPIKVPTKTGGSPPPKNVLLSHPTAAIRKPVTPSRTVVSRTAAQSHPVVYHPIYPTRQQVISHIQSMPTRPNNYAPHVTQPPAPINPTRAQVITHLQTQRRMPA